MGDRANVFVVERQGKDAKDVKGVYLYTHWAGHELAQVVQDALAKRWRWDDDSYLTRIIFDEMTKGDHGAETGYGISASMGDNGHQIIAVDPRQQRIGFCKEGAELKPGLELLWTFEEYVALSGEELGQAYLE